MDEKSCLDATWSPDGAQLVAVCGGVLHWFSLTTGEKIELPVECWESCRAVKWSPDGKWIAFQTAAQMNNKHDKEGIFLMSAACFAQPASCSTSKVEQVSPFPSTAPYAWSPDGKYLVIVNISRFAGEDSDNLILDFFNIQTRQVQRNLKIPGFPPQVRLTLAWSPDGKWVAFSGADGLYKVPVEGGAPVLVAQMPWPFIYQWLSIPHPFAPGAKCTITPAGNGLNLRDQPSQASKPLKVLKAGDEITIVKGPTLADGYTWWQMRTKDGVEGWAEDLPDWYAKE
jgi:WD40 repeat protein